MFRIRFHGRGGQGMKTASRILGTAFFLENFQVQDAPRYGAERRGAPIFAYVRADTKPIHERGIIHRPDLVIVADDSLVPIPAAGVLQGISANTVLLLNSHENSTTWQHRLAISNPIIILPISENTPDRLELKFISAICAGAAAALVKVIRRYNLEEAIQLELAAHRPSVISTNIQEAVQAYDTIHDHEDTTVIQGKPLNATHYTAPQWINLPFEQASVSAPTIHDGLTSVKVKTGLWRTMRPIINYDHCKSCWWVCSSFCPDGAINVENQIPVIDYDHCKGCMVCVAQCPPHAIESIPESLAIEQQRQQGTTI